MISGLQYLASDTYGVGGRIGFHYQDVGHVDDASIASESYVKGVKLWIRTWDNKHVVGGMVSMKSSFVMSKIYLMAPIV